MKLVVFKFIFMLDTSLTHHEYSTQNLRDGKIRNSADWLLQ